MKELAEEPMVGRIRKKGAGRKKVEEEQKDLASAIEELIEPKGDPMSVLRWKNKSLRRIKNILEKQKGIKVSEHVIANILRKRGYSLQANKKSLNEKKQDPKKRDKQFRYINRLANGFIQSGHAVIWMDAKKKEVIGNFKNHGKQYRVKGNPPLVNDHDFGKQKAIPYGIYDIAANEGLVNVGQDHDTAQFALASLRGWWEQVGRSSYPQAKYLMLTAESGGSNGSRLNQFTWQFQHVANETGLQLFVCHLPAGTSKWNKIEHRLFSSIWQNWAAEPLVSYELVLGFIGQTTTESGLKVRACLHTGTSHLHKTPTDKQMTNVLIPRHRCHPDWNYTITPAPQDTAP
jgi:transposase